MTHEELKKAIIELIDSRLSAMIPNTPSINAYKNLIGNMSEKALEAWVTALENGLSENPDLTQPRDLIRLVSPNLDKANAISVERNIALAEKLNIPLFEHLYLTNHVTGQRFKTNRRYLVLDVPVRRQAQTLDSKISLPEDDSHIDDLTGQVTGESKGASITYPEVQMLAAQGLTNTLKEMLKARGGDETAWAVMKNSLLKTGDFDLDELDRLNTNAKVNQSFSHYLYGMHIRNNVNDNT